MNKWLKVKKSPFEKGSTRVREGEGFGFQKIPRPSGTPFFKGGFMIQSSDFRKTFAEKEFGFFHSQHCAT